MGLKLLNGHLDDKNEKCDSSIIWIRQPSVLFARQGMQFSLNLQRRWRDRDQGCIVRECIHTMAVKELAGRISIYPDIGV